jgi:hypothetical protein
MKFIILFLISFSAVAGFPPTTLKGQSQSTATTTFNFQVPNNQATKTATGTLVETGSQNLLSNPGFEHSTVGTDWNASFGTLSSTASTPFGSAAASFTGSLSSSNIQSLTGSGTAQAGLNCLVSAFVKTASSNVQLCAIHNGTLNTNLCVNVNSNNAWAQYQIPTVCDATSTVARIRITTSTSTTFDVDNAYIGVQQLGTMASCSNPIACATSFTAAISSTGVVSNESLDFINGNCSIASTNQYTCTLNTLGISNPLRCVGSVALGNNGVFQIDYSGSPSTANFIYRTQRIDNVAEAENVNVTCFKTGTDYTSAIAQTPSINTVNADYDWTAYTPTFTGFGTATNIAMFHKRDGSMLKVKGSFTVGTVSGVALASITLPSSLTVDTTKVSINNTTANPGQMVGNYEQSEAAANTRGVMVLAPATSTSIVYLGNSETNATSAITPGLGTAVTASNLVMTVDFEVPIQGWNNNNVIVGTFAGVPQASGASTSIKMASFKFGGATDKSVCSTTPCTIYNSLSAGSVSTVTRQSLAYYTINWTSGFWSPGIKYNCTCISSYSLRPMGCSIPGNTPDTMNENSVTVQVQDTANTAVDAYVTVNCFGL